MPAASRPTATDRLEPAPHMVTLETLFGGFGVFACMLIFTGVLKSLPGVATAPIDITPVLLGLTLLHLAFAHLVENAIKFSPDGGAVLVRIWEDAQWVLVSIADHGIGIPQEHLHHIFDRFYQVDGSTTRHFGGMGIGLALVWDILEAHRGYVQVQSAVGQGSTFLAALPCATEG